MTLEEIDNLLLEDVRTEITQRVLAKYATELDGHPELMDELIDNEFNVYKQELRVEEEARLAAEEEAQAEADRIAQEEAERIAREEAEADAARRETIIQRLEAIEDLAPAYYALHSEPNMKLWVRDNIYSNQDTDDMDAKVTELEAKVLELTPAPIEVAKKDWEKKLREDLAANNITTDGLLEALVRKVLLDDTTLADTIKPKLEEINTRNPRPQETP